MKTDPCRRVLRKAREARGSVVLVYHHRAENGRAFRKRGSGFVIKTKGEDFLVLTNRHVLEGDKNKPFDAAIHKIFVRVPHSDGVEELIGHLRFIHPLVDLALIEVRGVTRGMPRALRFVPSREEQIGTTTFAIGYCNPHCFGGNYVKSPSLCPGSKVGPVIYKGSNTDAGLCLHTDSAVVHGCSGGVQLCNKGVIGVVRGGYAQVTVSVATESVQNVLKEWLGVPPEDGRTIQQLIDLL